MLPKHAELIINMLNDAGYEAYAVGGYMRDKLLGRDSDDIDITTNALPEQTKSVFKDFNVIETGIKHGTVTVLIDRTPYEVTTYRTDGEYTDSRHPDNVEFVRDVKTDLARRDFTMNAIAYSHLSGYLDFFGGFEDIQNRLIRTVGDPYKRFSEDALRILRALRFSSVLGFEIEEKTKKAIFDLSENINLVASERIFSELKKLLCGDNAYAVLKEYDAVLNRVIKLNGEVDNISKLPKDHSMRFAYVCGASVGESLRFLRADNQTKHICKMLVDSESIPNDITDCRVYCSRLGRENSRIVLDYRKALYNEDESGICEFVLKNDKCLSVSELDINGNDLIDIGISGKNIRVVLNELLICVLTDKIENKKESLLLKAKDIDIR